jgi:hypothetical protein
VNVVTHEILSELHLQDPKGLGLLRTAFNEFFKLLDKIIEMIIDWISPVVYTVVVQ